MFSGGTASAATGAPLPAAPSLTAPSLTDLREALVRLAAHDGAGLSEAGLVDHLTAMEQLKSGLAAAQARVTATLAASRSAREEEAGVGAEQRCRGLGHEVGLARQESPVRGRQHLGLALALAHELPHTLAALTAGTISEWAATLVARETAVLCRADRAAVDSELAAHFAGTGDRRLGDLARSIGYRLDPGSAIRRVRGAEADRRVGLRPAPDTMTHFTAHLPVAQGVACLAALSTEADRLRAAGDPRSRGQVMADTLVARLTGQQAAGSTPVLVNLVMTDRTLLDTDPAPAHLHGPGVAPVAIPAFLARRLVTDAEKAWVRRLYTHPTTGELVAMDSRARTFDGTLRQFVVLRDQTCRNTWCGAPIRHVDHPLRAADGSPTTADNAQGLCEACNYAKELPGWRTQRPPGPGHLVETITPTGHRYRSRSPDPPDHPGYPVHLDVVFHHHAA